MEAEAMECFITFFMVFCFFNVSLSNQNPSNDMNLTSWNTTESHNLWRYWLYWI